jgi:hypothetical protein
MLKYHLLAKNLNVAKFEDQEDNQFDWLKSTIAAKAPTVLTMKGNNLIHTGRVSISIKILAGVDAIWLPKKGDPAPVKKSRQT